MNKIKLIVGLNNPGSEYTSTRHNAGSWYVKLLAKRYNQLFKEKSKFLGYTAKINSINNSIYLLIPSTYMNLSGKSVLALTNYYHIKPAEILVAHDELDLTPGIIKMKFGGSNNGHNGLKDIQNKLGDNSNFYRLRIGIGHPGNKNKVAKFVLSRPTITEKKLLDNIIDEAIRYTPIILDKGLNKEANNLFNFMLTKAQLHYTTDIT